MTHTNTYNLVYVLILIVTFWLSIQAFGWTAAFAIYGWLVILCLELDNLGEKSR